MQYTISSEKGIFFTSAALHAGVITWARVLPAPPGTGIVFRRVDIHDRSNLIPARLDRVVATDSCTRIANDDGVSVSTIEHLMAALYSCGIHNSIIELNGPELPNMDGSARNFVNGILRAGKAEQGVPANLLKILKPVSIHYDGAFAELTPSDTPEMEFTIIFPELASGEQYKKLELKNGSIAKELSDCRTFCTIHQIFGLWEQKKALGGTLDTAVILTPNGVLTPGGFRKPDECVGHKMLDAVGDLALSGCVISGKFVGYKSGHSLTIKLLRKLFETEGAWEIAPADRELATELPGEGISFKSV